MSMTMLLRISLLLFLLYPLANNSTVFGSPTQEVIPYFIGSSLDNTNHAHPVAMSSNPFSSIQPRPKLPIEPDEFDPREIKAYYDWRNDMFFREFDLTGSGSVNFMTARRTYKVWLDEFGTPIVLTMGDPLFYWIDLNGNGTFEQNLGEMFKDSYEDGVTGNEEPYDNSDLQESAGSGPLWNPPQP